MASSLSRLIGVGAVDPSGNAWKDFNRFTTAEESQAYKDQLRGMGVNTRTGTPYGKNAIFDQNKVNDVVGQLDSLDSTNNAWRGTIDQYGKDYGDITTTEQENYLRSMPEYGKAWEANRNAENYLRPMGLWDKSVLGDSGSVLEPTKGREGFNIGKTLATTVGKNPWVLALPMLSAAAPALLGATGVGTGAASASTALPWATGASTGATAGAAGAGSGGWFSSLLKGIGSIPSMASEAVGGGTLGGIASGAVKGAAFGGLSSGLTGGNIGKGILSGALTGGATGGIGASLEGTELGDFLGIEPSVTSADSDFLSKAQAGSGLPWSASAEPSTLSSLGKSLGLTGGGTSSMGTLGMLLGGANNYFANNKALKQLKNAGNDAQALLDPYMKQGTATTSRLADLLGLSGNSGAEGYGSLAKSFSPTDLQNDPGYQFQLAEGQKALDRNSAARGGYYSGAALKDAAKYTQGLADTTYNDAFTRDMQNKSSLYSLLSGQQNLGADATNSTANIIAQLGGAGANVTANNANNMNSMLTQLLYGNRPNWGNYGF